MIRPDRIRAREPLRRHASAYCVCVHLAVRYVPRSICGKPSDPCISVRDAICPGDSVERERIITAELRVAALRLQAWRNHQNETHEYQHTYLLHFFLVCWLGTQLAMKT